VKAVQTAKGSRASNAKAERRGWRTRVTPDLIEFLSGLDMFYLGTANAEGQPYIQYRGGSPGFLKVLDDRTLAFADFGGNRQYITLGNLSDNPKAFIFLMDYANSQRVKLWGTASVVEDDADLLERLRDPDYPGKVERAIVFTVEAWDINCLQHIHQRFSQRQVQPVIEQLQRRISELEAQLAQRQAHDSRTVPARDGQCPGRILPGPGPSPRDGCPQPSFPRKEPSMTSLKVAHRIVSIDGLDIFYREAGPKDAPTVLLLHGFPASSHMFRNLIPALADRYRVLAPDYPGFGHNSMPPRDEFAYTFDNLAGVVEEFTAMLGRRHSVHVSLSNKESRWQPCRRTGWIGLQDEPRSE
jgi:predicted pyridoxine 5'-phosphate oxidase superfamily flavin-nucleotide-binding protein